MFESNPEKHAESKKKHPGLHLSDGEFVVAEVRRHPIGLFSIWFVDLLIVAIIIALSILIAGHASEIASNGVTVSPDIILGAMALLTILVLLLGWVGHIIYTDNRFYVTNESVIQHIRVGLFTSREQTVSLAGVEDASYRQEGILQYILGYGSIRLSTVGDENTYRFTLVANPQDQLRTLNDAVEDFKRRHVFEGINNGTPAAPPQPQASQPPTTNDQTS